MRMQWMGVWLVLGILASFFVSSPVVLATDLNECMTKKMLEASDDVTVGHLRLQCEKEIHSGQYIAAQQEDEAVSERIRQDKEHVLQPFTIMTHKPNYILIGAHNFKGYDSSEYQEAWSDPTVEADDTEAQFQLSMKFPLAIDLFDTVDLYAAYTNRSFWQVYNKDISAPFRETNHEPEGWLQFNPKWKLWGFTNTSNQFGIVHQSNGRGANLSRSWNRLYANFIIDRGNFALSFKPWYRIPEDDEDDDNPDITDYLGHYELRAAYKLKGHVFSLMSRNNLESGFERGALEAGWSFPLFNYPYLKGYIQYFTGYGESLIDYDKYVNRIGFGVAISDWL